MLTSPEDFPPSSAYVCLKFALEGFSESMAHELEQFKIKVILIEPWEIKTSLERKLGIRVSLLIVIMLISHMER